ncbi:MULTISPECIES: HIT family protein [Leeuwenhoekiella]|jgi:histidine triad (HIT) family protein|uniref:HIT family protein n=1 Tax=Leeuwenhoekiella blandensis (strain CECT 7118 / CCUG 51940 / KCTC 22103 / MED217) TaxID=398720 RepID=A3XQ48_LEEBM|nr:MULTISPECIES: HIT family protein [Leeuwenhoekiella]EAQ48321.1 HIT family protein [Leeuwenhoekiella blandensis MED217]MAO43902.1 HIT family protein [Leeuwenhoekiella sp.]HBT10758.1 HIT family protein [Leeuwenhoekiella sp.]HCW63569.1 HIT family protein [Leeuwenhoekiella sp.]|tara:strand:- start:3817 stop:4206 length:390 start_codon:yes stop_codon:yes gene_type:complete
MASIFTKIINREIPGHIVAEDAQHIAILDINPNAKGHTLCIPKKEVNKIFDLPEEDYMALMAFSRKVALALEQVVTCERIGVSVIGLEVPHVHVHLIPLTTMEDARFINKTKLDQEEFKALAQQINEAL